MKINEKILSIPPYISTTWENISSIKMKGSLISITLKDGDSIDIPTLEKETIDLIFTTHAEQIEKTCFQNLYFKEAGPEIEKKQHPILSQTLFGQGQHMGNFPLKFEFATLDGLNMIAEHNPQEMNAPNLPDLILEKIGSIAKIVAPDELAPLPKDVPNCNCFHCQITRTINGNMSKEINEEVIVDEVVLDDELQFNQWNVTLMGENLYKVTNKLDSDEQYNVFLGSPVGCNCGHTNCEHIIAALRS